MVQFLTYLFCKLHPLLLNFFNILQFLPALLLQICNLIKHLIHLLALGAIKFKTFLSLLLLIFAFNQIIIELMKYGKHISKTLFLNCFDLLFFLFYRFHCLDYAYLSSWELFLDVFDHFSLVGYEWDFTGFEEIYVIFLILLACTQGTNLILQFPPYWNKYLRVELKFLMIFGMLLHEYLNHLSFILNFLNNFRNDSWIDILCLYLFMVGVDKMLKNSISYEIIKV